MTSASGVLRLSPGATVVPQSNFPAADPAASLTDVLPLMPELNPGADGANVGHFQVPAVMGTVL